MNTEVEADYSAAVRRHSERTAAPARITRAAFYERVRNAYAVVMTGELRAYGNLILKKGVTRVA
jgi:L-fucose mutarotase